MFAIVSNMQKKNNFLSKPPKITNPNKPVRNIFDRRYRKKPLLNKPFPTKCYPCLDISLFCYSYAVHNNLA